MARQPRIALAGRPHLLIQSTAADLLAFVDDDDRRAYLAAMFESSRGAGVTVHAYALVDRQVQLLVTPESADSLGRFMQRLGRRYVAAFNQRHQGAGRLWKSRFASAALLSERYLLPALLMIEQLPVRNDCTGLAGHWQWSSAAHHLGSHPDARVVSPTAYWALGNTPFERQGRYAELLASPLDQKQIRHLETAARAGWPVGSTEDVADAERSVGGLRLRPGLRGRPRGN